jgi:hypothetical protein
MLKRRVLLSPEEDAPMSSIKPSSPENFSHRRKPPVSTGYVFARLDVLHLVDLRRCVRTRNGAREDDFTGSASSLVCYGKGKSNRAE